MAQTQDLRGNNNLIIQIDGHGNTVIAADKPHLILTKHQARRVVREQDGNQVETDLLSAYTQSIPIRGAAHHSMLAELTDWLGSDNAISVRVVIGRAGRGKTRLALELI